MIEVHRFIVSRFTPVFASARIIHVLLFLPLVFGAQGSRAQSSVPQVRGQIVSGGTSRTQDARTQIQKVKLTLTAALSKTRTGNRTYKLADLTFKGAELDFADAWDTMFMPNISLYGSASSFMTFGAVKETPAFAAGIPAYNYGYPSKTFGIQMGEYTIFNFFKDQLAYEKSRLAFDRAKEKLSESERAVRFSIITAYYSLLTSQEKLDAAKRSLTIAGAILDLVNSQVRLGKATESEVSSATVDKLSAASEVNTLSAEFIEKQRGLALLLGDPIDTQYVLTSPLKYIPLNITEKQAIETAERNSPGLRDARLGVRTAQIDKELAQKERLPLPKVTITGVSFGYTSNYYSTPSTQTSTSGSNAGALEVATAISFSIPLTGPGGLFNNRVSSRAQMAQDVAEIGYIDAASSLKADTFSKIYQIKQLEQTIENQKQSVQQSENVLNKYFSNLSKEKVSRLELRDAIKAARDAQLQILDSILNHLSSKLGLADAIGDASIVGALE